MSQTRRKSRKRHGLVKSKDDSYQSSKSVRRRASQTFLKLTLLSSRTPYDEFHHLFKHVPKDQFPINNFSCALSREILLQGRLFISQGWFCFYSNIFGWETQVTIDCRKIRSITREKTAYVVPNAILITTTDEKHFLSSFLSRETVYKLLIKVWKDISEKPQSSIPNGVSSTVNREPSEESLLENLPFHDVIENDDENEISNAQDVESKLSADSGFFEGQPAAILVTELDSDEQKLIAFDKSLQEEVQCSSSKLPTFASIAVCIASMAEMLYSYFQVGLRLIKRLSKEQLFILVAAIIIMFLMCCSAFLLYRLSVLEPKVFAPRTPTKAYISQQSIQQILKLRKEVYDAEVLRVKKIVSANIDAITQIRDTLKMLQDDLMNQIHQNCTIVDNNVCLMKL
ncbi:protein Aster-B-like isoform X2 [Actinia tenebrosa]|uniref:Protein Aster-B-like isoform X2 n=1 Tax=Actinia tenebrosa TaxID=6105 RepID=A0A6P8IZX5_ACTTE|nr:protein Aster-B-like isoform X2 [Actinia tenebrosa]